VDVRQQAAPAAKIVVLGAGMSGRAAAYELMLAGYDVKVLEGRDVPGGRVQTIREGFTPGLYAEAGAIFLPGDQSLTQHYAKIFNVPLEGFAHFDLPSLYFLQGQRIIDPPPKGAPPNNWPFDLTVLEEQLGLGTIAGIYCQSAFTVGTVDENWPSPSEAVFDQIEYDTRMKGMGASAGARNLLSQGYLSVYGDGPASYSALMMLYDEWYTDRFPNAFQVVGGNDVFPKTDGRQPGQPHPIRSADRRHCE
jgi:monoamine oxidase